MYKKDLALNNLQTLNQTQTQTAFYFSHENPFGMLCIENYLI